ncbi:globin [Thioalkalivibrio sp.]|uniref:globin n=1 Tax=Thioalkalivibrio sp. TaxID=2093813 RepID=UPI003569B8D0
MNTQLIAQSWNDIADDHPAIAETFYSRLFERYPEYASLFNEENLPQQMDRMVRTLAMVSSNADSAAAIRPHLTRVGEAHADFGLGADDLNNFSQTMIEVIAEYCDNANGAWSEACEQAWKEAFSQIVEPMMLDGMKH